jgi:hypothetical protein
MATVPSTTPGSGSSFWGFGTIVGLGVVVGGGIYFWKNGFDLGKIGGNLIEGTTKGIINASEEFWKRSYKDVLKPGYNKVLKPLSVSSWKKVIKPGGKATYNKVLKPTAGWFKKEGKSIGSFPKKAFSKKKLKKALRFGF